MLMIVDADDRNRDNMNKKHQAINRVRQWVASFFARQSQHICPCFHTVLQLCSGCAFLRRLKEHFSCSSGDSTHRSGAIAYNNAKPTEDADLSGKSPEELAAYVFEHPSLQQLPHHGRCRQVGIQRTRQRSGQRIRRLHLAAHFHERNRAGKARQPHRRRKA
jgi:hypothetical protein